MKKQESIHDQIRYTIADVVKFPYYKIEPEVQRTRYGWKHKYQDPDLVNALHEGNSFDRLDAALLKFGLTDPINTPECSIERKGEESYLIIRIYNS